jgi:cardiolipin synthase
MSVMNRSISSPTLPVTRKYRFPWRGGNRFELLIDGQAFFPRMLQAIDSARASVWFELYLFESGAVADRFIAAFVRAAARGVDVRVLLDDFGAYRLNSHDRERLEQAGVRLVFYNQLHYGKLLHNMFRDHRKLLLVDGRVGFVGGAGVADAFDPPTNRARRWRETMARIEGPVLGDWQVLFIDVWNHHAPDRLRTPAVPLRSVLPRDATPGRVTATSGMLVQEIIRSLINQIRNAERRVWISTAYFIPSRKIRRALRHAAKQGVDVRLLLPGRHTDHPAIRHAGRRFYMRLLHSGVRIYEFQPRFLHSKVILCDDWVSIGSSNLDRWNLHWNLEANQEIDDRDFAEEVRAMFERDFAEAAECDYETLLRRPWYARVWERFWGRADLWLAQLGRLRAMRRARPPVAFGWRRETSKSRRTAKR